MTIYVVINDENRKILITDKLLLINCLLINLLINERYGSLFSLSKCICIHFASPFFLNTHLYIISPKQVFELKIDKGYLDL